jgi:predicted HD phosphohydrolase
VAAAIVKPFVSEANHWMIQQHGIFQGYYFFHHLGLDRNMRDQFAGHEHYARTEEFCALYDGPAFNPSGETLPLEHFEPMVRRVFATPKHSIYRSVVSAAE